ncbi:unnamed protein product, partial [Didymodactylos carnosus]
DLCLRLAEKYEELKGRQPFTMMKLYRGVALPNHEFENVKQSENKLISANGFFSTSQSREVALYFAGEPTTNSTPQSVLFEIECDIPTKMAILGDIAEISNFTSEKEILFDLGAAFEIQTIELN